MRKRDGFLEMENPTHLLEDWMKGLLHVGIGLWKKVVMGTLVILRIHLRKGGIFKHLAEKKIFLQQELVFLFLLRDLIRYKFFSGYVL